MKTQLKADLMLVLVTLCWGVSYYLMDVALADLSPFTLNAYRFIGAFLVAGIFAYGKLKTVNRITLKYSLLIGGALVFVYMGATFGVKYTTLSNSGFFDQYGSSARRLALSHGRCRLRRRFDSDGAGCFS